MAQDEPPAVPLEYAQFRRQRRRWKRWALAALIGVIGYGAWRWGGDIVERVSYQYWQHQCMTYTAPADRVAVELDPARVKVLLSGDNGYISGSTIPGRPMAVCRIRCSEKLGIVVWGSGTQGAGGNMVFLHGRRTPKGQERLVAVGLELYAGLVSTAGSNTPSFPCLNYTVEPPQSLFTWQHPASGLVTFGMSSCPVPDNVVRVFAGQIDPADESHFTIEFEVSTGGALQRRICDGWLKDGDDVALELRPTDAATKPTNPSRQLRQ